MLGRKHDFGAGQQFLCKRLQTEAVSKIILPSPRQTKPCRGLLAGTQWAGTQWVRHLQAAGLISTACPVPNVFAVGKIAFWSSVISVLLREWIDRAQRVCRQGECEPVSHLRPPSMEDRLSWRLPLTLLTAAYFKALLKMPRGTGVTAFGTGALIHSRGLARRALFCETARWLFFCFFSPECRPQQFSVRFADLLKLTF